MFQLGFGTLTSHGPIDPRWGLGKRFIENLGLGAIITTWELTLLDVRKLENLLVDLESGMTIGHAAGFLPGTPGAEHRLSRS
jgi:hypothetical protein